MAPRIPEHRRGREKLHRQLLAIPRDGKDGPMTFTIPGEGSAKLQSQLDAMEAQLRAL